METVLFKKFDPKARVPEKAHDSDFAYDLFPISEKEIAPNTWEYGFGFGLQYTRTKTDGQTFIKGFSIRPRSSVWKTGMLLTNAVGTIDSGYTGEIKAVFYHYDTSKPRYTVESGKAIAQLFPEVTDTIKFYEVGTLLPTERGENGYGSTDNKN